MHDQETFTASMPKHAPWNKGKLTGAKPPLRPKHVWSIRSKLQLEGRTRDLAMFNLAIDSKLRGRDVLALRVIDIAPTGHAAQRATCRQTRLVGRSSLNSRRRRDRGSTTICESSRKALANICSLVVEGVSTL